MKTFKCMVWVYLLVALGGCVSDIPHRVNSSDSSASSVMEETYAKGGMSGKYSIGFVEFDDQGYIHDPSQFDRLFKHLEQFAAREEKVLIVTYTHGWKHNASAEDRDVKKFKQLLSQLDIIEQTRKRAAGKPPRRVVGVYLGWRGQSIDIPFVSNLTFWTRKNVAERVGSRGAKQLFSQLIHYRAFANGWETTNELAKSDETQLIMVGHSFGGLINFHAIHTQLIERGLEVHATGRYRTAKSYGDLLLLINPAFEGSAYHSIWQAALTRGCYRKDQRPALVVVTSEADFATKLTFPLGRLYTFLQSAPQKGQRAAVLNTVGHTPAYQTHTLTPLHPEKANKDVNAEEAAAKAQEVAEAMKQEKGSLNNTARIELQDTVLAKIENRDAPSNIPYLVVSAHRKIIKDHNDIWNDTFQGFMVEFLSRQIVAEPPPDNTPCPSYVVEVPLRAAACTNKLQVCENALSRSAGSTPAGTPGPAGIRQ